ncbi:MAG: ATP-dependent DNA helicase RecG [bacterium]|nr:ATP-dependent DNA helicase RecG [bacterium]
MDLRTPVTELPAVRETVARGLRRLGIVTVRDLLFHFPRRHDDRRALTPIRDVRPGETTVVKGVLTDMHTEQSFRRSQKGTRPVVVTSARITDETGALPVRWFHQRYLDRTYPTGTEVYLVGGTDTEGQLVAPEIERVRANHPPIHVGRLVPVYPETAGVSSRMLRYLVSRVLPLAATLREYLPSSTKDAEHLVDFPTAVAQMHFPDDEEQLARARERLAFDELFLLQLAALVRRAARSAETAQALNVSEATVADAIQTLPFVLTASQMTALHSILHDVAQPVPMARLLAGDVGSGKTVVAGLAALAVARAGGQTALLAPTEILAQQHAATLSELFGSVGLHLGLLTASTPPLQRAEVSADVASGALSLLVGTHALLHAPLRFQNLTLVIVDEQHRFGVLQRGELTRRGGAETTPHFLSLSATPIPRTLQLTAYGDVEVSPLDPRPGQQPVRTEIVPPSTRNTMYASLQHRIQAGGQVFVVCSRVKELPDDDRSAEILPAGRSLGEGWAKAERRSVEAEYKRLKQELFPSARIERLHGKLPADEKSRILDAFRAHELDLLVASTVIEVGVDIPNADTLLVEGAEHFGLATLHQLRGRVGRRGQDAVCFLATETDEAAALERLQVLVRTNNGLEIAEEDLRQRGPGELTGTRQHGGVTLKVASFSDLPFLLRVRAAAERLLQKDAVLQSASLLAARIRQLNVTTHFE